MNILFCFLEKLSPLNALRNYGDRWGKLRRVRKHESHLAASLRWFSGQSEAGNLNASGTGESKYPGARLDLTVNFHHEHSIVPTNFPWVSEDGVLCYWGRNVRAIKGDCKLAAPINFIRGISATGNWTPLDSFSCPCHARAWSRSSTFSSFFITCVRGRGVVKAYGPSNSACALFTDYLSGRTQRFVLVMADGHKRSSTRKCGRADVI